MSFSASKFRLVMTVLAACAAGSMTQAALAKPVVEVPLASYTVGYTQTTFADLLANSSGLLNFTLLGESTAHSDKQTFSVNGGVVFTGPDQTGAIFSLIGPLTSIEFRSNPGEQYAPGGNGLIQYFKNASGTSFLLAYEDFPNGGIDYNDMVVGMNVTAVPEPESVALALAGLGMLGFMARRRRVI